MKGRLKSLIKKYPVDVLEKHLVYHYLALNGMDREGSNFFWNYFRDFTIQPSLQNQVAKLAIYSLMDLEECLELLIPLSDRKLNGAFFTPDYIVDFIINEVKPEYHDKCLDPSAGSGAFLLGLADYFKKQHGKSIQQTVRENITGVDILPYNVRRAKVILALFALHNGELLEETDFCIFCQNSLRKNWEKQYDVIVGNPPYVKFQDLNIVDREALYRDWETVNNGTFNLYFAFFELGYQLLKPNGKLGYITPNNYFTSLAGERLRNFFTQKQCVTRIIDFNDRMVFDARTYTAITFLSKASNDSLLYDRVNGEEAPKAFLQHANGSPNYFSQLNIKKWRLLKSEEQENIKAIETIGTPLYQLFEIVVGIATLKDDVFFVDGQTACGDYYLKTTSRGTFNVEKAITKPVYKISDFNSQQEVDRNTRRIICPYRFSEEGVHQIPESEMKEHFPGCYEYLCSQKAILKNRDKGKHEFTPFYAWGRTQGLSKRGKKLLTPTFSQFPRFFQVYEEDAYFTNGYGIYFKHNANDLFPDMGNLLALEENIDVVRKILNSTIMDYYVRKTSVTIAGGYPCYQKNFIERFTIPQFSEAEIEILRQKPDQKAIDQFLLAKYQLNIPEPNLLT